MSKNIVPLIVLVLCFAGSPSFGETHDDSYLRLMFMFDYDKKHNKLPSEELIQTHIESYKQAEKETTKNLLEVQKRKAEKEHQESVNLFKTLNDANAATRDEIIRSKLSEFGNPTRRQQITRYGNYCGDDMTGGLWKDKSESCKLIWKKPIDQVDEACRKHDYAYIRKNLSKDTPVNNPDRRNADLKLIKNMGEAKTDIPYGTMYKSATKRYFEWKNDVAPIRSPDNTVTTNQQEQAKMWKNTFDYMGNRLSESLTPFGKSTSPKPRKYYCGGKVVTETPIGSNTSPSNSERQSSYTETSAPSASSYSGFNSEYRQNSSSNYGSSAESSSSSNYGSPNFNMTNYLQNIIDAHLD